MGIMAAHTGWVSLVRFLPDGKKAITASHDGTARCVFVCLDGGQQGELEEGALVATGCMPP